MWNDDWRDELKQDNLDCYIRLCECRNNKKDLKLIAKLMYKYNMNKDKRECLDRTIEWLSDWNNQTELDLDVDEYNKILENM